MSGTYITKPRLTIVAAALVLVYLLASVHSALANGAHPGAREVFSGNSGPHFISATTTPIVGQQHWAIYITQLDETEAVSGVTLHLTGKLSGLGHSSLENVKGQPSNEGPHYYTIDFPLNMAGDWIFTLTVNSQLGSSTIDIPLTVVRSGGINFGIVGLGGAVIVLISLIALSASRRRKQKNPLGSKR